LLDINGHQLLAEFGLQYRGAGTSAHLIGACCLCANIELTELHVITFKRTGEWRSTRLHDHCRPDIERFTGTPTQCVCHGDGFADAAIFIGCYGLRATCFLVGCMVFLNKLIFLAAQHHV
jgi:hypothetical protein